MFFWLIGLPLKGSPGLKDWIQFPELENIYQTQHTRESVKKNYGPSKLGKGTSLGVRKTYLAQWHVSVTTHHRAFHSLQMKDIIPPRKIAVIPPNESEDVILIWTPFVECLYENYEI